MKKSEMIKIAVMGLFIILGGCASYKATGAVPSNLGEGNIVRVEKNGIEASALSVKTGEDSMRYFDEDLSKKLLAIYVSLVNRTSDEAEIVSLDLKTGGGETLQPSLSGVAYGIVRRSIGWRAFILGLPTYFAGSAASAVHTNNVNVEIKNDLEAKSLLESSKKIGPFETAQGFVWFKMPEGGFPKGTALDIFLAVGKERKMVKYEIPIPD